MIRFMEMLFSSYLSDETVKKEMEIKLDIIYLSVYIWKKTTPDYAEGVDQGYHTPFDEYHVLHEPHSPGLTPSHLYSSLVEAIDYAYGKKERDISIFHHLNTISKIEGSPESV